MDTQQKRNLSTKEAAARLGVCAATVCRLIKSGRIKAFKLSEAKSGAGYRIPETELERLEIPARRAA
jgi:excisionase family DNA binding protein